MNELKEVKAKLQVVHNSTLDVEHKLTKTEDRLKLVIREILESRKYVREIHMQQQQVNDRIQRSLERIEGFLLSKISNPPAPEKDENLRTLFFLLDFMLFLMRCEGYGPKGLVLSGWLSHLHVLSLAPSGKFCGRFHRLFVVEDVVFLLLCNLVLIHR